LYLELCSPHQDISMNDYCNVAPCSLVETDPMTEAISPETSVSVYESSVYGAASQKAVNIISLKPEISHQNIIFIKPVDLMQFARRCVLYNLRILLLYCDVCLTKNTYGLN
jgi:hypothetical protein